MAVYETYPVEVAGVQRDLRLFEIKPGVRIAILNILGDTELVEAASKELAGKLTEFNPEVLVTAEAKSIPLAHAMSLSLNGCPMWCSASPINRIWGMPSNPKHSALLPARRKPCIWMKKIVSL